MNWAKLLEIIAKIIDFIKGFFTKGT